ncbi:hypothetical protein [Paenarthrobacter ureafaciens]|jgi:hypothetical protein|uniref:hypothetical protein n=1 Tax=Paenarthrobacter ureafaciens TaxID=37931 RepID=UPI001409619A|nr:hypothetical protein [Paenarthrobacter ureafaciens]MCX8456542.1 hypothetical protein [Paenarthrobacter ureafaciens]MCY0974405.1 hypothetical protein [Paenarthrobacter ureafaciens]
MHFGYAWFGMIRLMLRERGAPIREIVATTGLAESTLYRHLPPHSTPAKLAPEYQSTRLGALCWGQGSEPIGLSHQATA